MNDTRLRIFGWLLLIINIGYCALGLVTGSMEGLGEVFGWFTASPHVPTTYETKPIAFILGLAAHAALALYGVSLIWRGASR
jgi:hypothetical protein